MIQIGSLIINLWFSPPVDNDKYKNLIGTEEKPEGRKKNTDLEEEKSPSEWKLLEPNSDLIDKEQINKI